MVDNFSMPIEWLLALRHPKIKDKASLLHNLKYEYTVSDVHDLLEYLDYENWVAEEEYKRESMKKY